MISIIRLLISALIMLISCSAPLGATKHSTIQIRTIPLWCHGVRPFQPIGKHSLAVNPKGNLLVFPAQDGNAFSLLDLKTNILNVIKPDWQSIIPAVQKENKHILRIPCLAKGTYSFAEWSSNSDILVAGFSGVPSFVLLFQKSESDSPLQHIKTLSNFCDTTACSIAPDSRLLAIGSRSSLFLNTDSQQKSTVTGELNFLRIVDMQNNYENVITDQIQDNNLIIITRKLTEALADPQKKQFDSGAAALSTYCSKLDITLNDLSWVNNKKLVASTGMRGHIPKEKNPFYSTSAEIKSQQCAFISINYDEKIADYRLINESPVSIVPNDNKTHYAHEREYIKSTLSGKGNPMLLHEQYVDSEGYNTFLKVTSHLLCDDALEELEDMGNADQQIIDTNLLTDGTIAVLSYEIKERKHKLVIIKNDQEDGYSQTYWLPTEHEYNDRTLFDYKPCITSTPQGDAVILVRENRCTGNEEMVFIDRMSVN